MRFGRTLPPAAAPLTPADLLGGLWGMVRGSAELERRRDEFARYFGSSHCYLCSSGKAALVLILTALKARCPERDGVLIPAFTCYSVPSAIVKAGLRPILCDIDPETLDFDFGELQHKLADPRLLCVVPTHLFGLPADIRRIRSLIRDDGVTVVEDAAQVMGGEWQGEKLGTLGDVGFFSLGRGKALSAVTGGIILTRDDELGRQIGMLVEGLSPAGGVERLKLLGYALALIVFQRPELYWLPAAMPFLKLGSTQFAPQFAVRRLTSFQAGLLRGWQRKLGRLRRVRGDNARFWAAALGGAAMERRAAAGGIPDLVRYPLLVDSEESCRGIAAAAARCGLGLALTYPDAVSGIPALGDLVAGRTFPVARRTARQLLTLPVHGGVTAADRRRICDLLAGTGSAGGAAVRGATGKIGPGPRPPATKRVDHEAAGRQTSACKAPKNLQPDRTGPPGIWP